MNPNSDSTGTTKDDGGRNSGRKIITVLTLALLNLSYYMDRFSIAGVLIEIQCDFNVSNAEGGLLQTAFIFSYVIFAPIFGYLGDRYSRRLIIGTGVSIWSCAMLTSTFMTEFWWFLGLRALAGIGEASFTSIAPALISDLFNENRRSKYLALYYFAVPVGSGLGFITAALITQSTESWRWGLRVTPFMGILGVLLTLVLLYDPPRGSSDGSPMKPTSWSQDLRHLYHNQSFLMLCIATTSVAFVTGSYASWGPTYLALGLATQSVEQSAMDLVSPVLGAVVVLAGVMGVVTGAFLGQRLRKKYPTADPLICGIGLISATPLAYVGTILASGPTVPVYIMLFLSQWLLNLNWSLSNDMLMSILVPTRRSTAKATQIVLNHVLGDASSPYVIGQVSQSIKFLLDPDQRTGSYSSHYGYQKIYPIWKTDSEADCITSPINEETANRDFHALQYALFIGIFVQVIGGFFFLAISWNYVQDKNKVRQGILENEEKNQRILSEVHDQKPQWSSNLPVIVVSSADSEMSSVVGSEAGESSGWNKNE